MKRRVVTGVVSAICVGALLAAAPGMAVADDDPPGPLSPALQDVSAGRSSDGSLTPASSILTRPNGRVVINVRLRDTAEDSLARLRAAGARVRFVDQSLRTVTITMAPEDVGSLDGLGPLVESAQEVLTPMTNAACPTGPFVSEGVGQLKAALARSQFSVTGRDVTVGILSDTYDVTNGASVDVNAGDLPGSGNPCGNGTTVGNLVEGPGDGSDEGRAMAQIVHDVAPGAKLLFASAFLGDLAFAQSIRDLAAQGADIIVDDITYFNEPMYQDGPIAKAVADVTAQGVTYFSSAANSNKVIGGNSVGSYETTAFRQTACPALINTEYSPAVVSCHDFDPTGGVNPTYPFTYSGNLTYTLGWNEPAFGVTTDLDLCLLNVGLNTVRCASSANLTTQQAFEFAAFSGSGSRAWIVVRKQGATPRFKLISHRSDLVSVTFNTSAGGDIVGPTIFGHNASLPGVTVAAVPFDNSGVLETFSSRGPATYCWGPVVGTSPAAALSPCQTATIDLSATDGTQNSFFGDISGGFHRFYGTSAAAPHAAAVAALMLDKEQCLTPAQVIAALKSSGRSVGAAPVDGAGAGLIDSQAAVTAASAVNCDTSGPLIDIDSGPGIWLRTAAASLPVAATDHRLVTSLTCTGADLGGVSGTGTTRATGTISFAGEGLRTITCQGTDVEGNVGAAPGSKNSVNVGIDTTAPLVTCRPATLRVGQPGTVAADVSDGLSGPASATVSVSVPTASAGTFSAALTGSDLAGNTATASCGYTVAAVPSVSGPAKVKAGAKKRYTARGFPPSAAVTWTLKRKGKVVAKANLRSNSAGVSTVKIRIAKKGRYVVQATSGPVSARTPVRAR